jgi:hypothetical protein
LNPPVAPASWPHSDRGPRRKIAALRPNNGPRPWERDGT